MKNYTITVNGTVYDVTVEENGAGAAPAAPATPAAPKAAPEAAPKPAPAAPKAAPKAASKPAPAASAPAAGAGSIKVEAGAAGKVFKLEAGVGQKLSRGETVMIIEAMKMEIPIVAPEDGTVASIEVAVGDSIEAGQVLATMN